jgi:hypothetical protein
MASKTIIFLMIFPFLVLPFQFILKIVSTQSQQFGFLHPTPRSYSLLQATNLVGTTQTKAVTDIDIAIKTVSKTFNLFKAFLSFAHFLVG